MARRLRRDERGQMMLLSAVVLIFAFLALSAMVSRVSQLGSVTTADQDRPLLLEVDTVSEAVDGILVDLQAVVPDLNATSTPTLDATLQASLRHLAALEAARGFRFEFGGDSALDGTVDCTDSRIHFQLSDGELRVNLVSTVTFAC